MVYDFKWAQEAGFAILIAVATVGLEILVTFDPAQVADWKSWGVGIGAGMVRAAAVAALRSSASGRPRRDSRRPGAARSADGVPADSVPAVQPALRGSRFGEAVP